MPHAPRPTPLGSSKPLRLGPVLLVAAIIGGATPVLGHGEVMRIGSSQVGGGQIVVEPEFVFGSDVFSLPRTAQAGGSSLYSDIFPSFAWILAAARGFYPLSEEVSVTFTVAAPISGGASVRVGGRTLDAPGESATLGSFENDPESHVHPEWRLLLPNDVKDEYQVSFRLSAQGFADSPVYTLLTTNAELAATPSATAEATATAVPSAATVPTGTTEDTPSATATATVSPTHSAAPAVCPGDCDGNGWVSIAELVRAVGLAGRGGAEGCAAADGNGDGVIGINELIRAMRSALEGCATQ